MCMCKTTLFECADYASQNRCQMHGSVVVRAIGFLSLARINIRTLFTRPK